MFITWTIYNLYCNTHANATEILPNRLIEQFPSMLPLPCDMNVIKIALDDLQCKDNATSIRPIETHGLLVP